MTALLISLLAGLVLGLAGALWCIGISRKVKSTKRDQAAEALLDARKDTQKDRTADTMAHEEIINETAEMLVDNPDRLAADVDAIIDRRSEQ